MSKTLIYTDSHINIDSLGELEEIFKEIYSYDGDRLIMVGDFFNRKNPTPQEILFGTKVTKQAVDKYKEVIYVRGNHDKTKEISAIDYLKHFGVKVVNDFTDENNNYFGHFMLHESKTAYGTGKIGLKEIRKKYNYVILGHNHDYQEFCEKVRHLGSIRFVGFGENKKGGKYIATLTDKLKLHRLTTTIPMKDVDSVEELKHLPERTKVRLIISSFEQFKKEVNKINNYRSKFSTFKTKIDIKDKSTELQKSTKSKNVNEIVNEFIDKIKDEEVKNELRKQFREEL